MRKNPNNDLLIQIRTNLGLTRYLTFITSLFYEKLMGLLNIITPHSCDLGAIDVNSQGNGQKSPSSKAAAFSTRGAYSQYVSTAKGRPACA